MPGTKFRQWRSLKHILSVPLSATTKSSSLVYSSNFNFHSNRQFNNIWTSSKNVSFYITLLCKKSLKETASFGLCAVTEILGRRRRLTFLAPGYSTLVTTVKGKQENWLLSWIPITAVGKTMPAIPCKAEKAQAGVEPLLVSDLSVLWLDLIPTN